jgi:DNA-directed RNA polymerase II subunit RPB1
MGHPGHIEFAFPVPHYLFLEKILKVLRVVCFWCSECLIDIKDPVIIRRFAAKKRPPARLAAISMHCRKRACKKCSSLECKGVQPIYSKQGVYLHKEWDANTVFTNEDERKIANEPFTAKIARDILRLIDKETCEFIGLDMNSRPEYMILTVFPVPPPLIRPTTMISDSSRTKGHVSINMSLYTY